MEEFFLWDNSQIYKRTEIISINGISQDIMLRPLNEFDTLFVRYNEGVNVLHKIASVNSESIQKILSPLMPYGFSTNVIGLKEKEECYITLIDSRDTSYIPSSIVTKGVKTIGTYRALISKTSAEHAGEPDKSGKLGLFLRV
ncbi:hypothetical protein [Arcanobacterium hippocoleae]|uniref:hypothetical protein n=1 Tax=Arcanobacterium hippocoleae TaxID=149017 RepID=UPI00334264C3